MNVDGCNIWNKFSKHDNKKIAKNLEKEEKLGEKRKNQEEKGKNQESSFILPLLTDRPG